MTPAVQLAGTDYSEGRLPKKSIIKTTKLFTIHSSLIVKKVCALTREKTEETLTSVRGILFMSEGQHRVDRLKDSRHANMQELWFSAADGV